MVDAMMQINDAGWLVPESPRLQHHPTVRTSPLAVPEPLGIVWHYTAGRGGPGFAERLAKSIRTYKRGVDRAASWHLVIAKNGDIFQSAPCLVGTWHVGRPGEIAGRQFKNVNRATIGVELENAGRLRQIDGAWYCWPYWRDPSAPIGQRVPSAACRMPVERVVVLGGGRGAFDAYPPAQVRAAKLLLDALVARYGWQPRDRRHGHADFVGPRYKEDPGPLWAEIVAEW